MQAVLPKTLRTLRSFSTLIVLFVGGGSIYILPYLSSYFYIPMTEAMDLNNMQIGLMGSALGFTSMIFYWPGGWMADRFSPRKLIAFSMFANGILGFWLATIPRFEVLLVIQLLMGVLLTLTYWSALIKMVRLLAPSDQQGRYFGILEGGRNLSGALVVAASLYVFKLLGSSESGLRWAIVLCSTVLLVIGVLSWMCLPEDTSTSATKSAERSAMTLLTAVVLLAIGIFAVVSMVFDIGPF